MKTKKKIKSLLKDSYLAMIKNSQDCKMFRNFYALINGKKQDILNNGEFSCAFFVSSILVIFGLVKKTHCTVMSVLKDMEGSGWTKIKLEKIKPGSVILWEGKKDGKDVHKHLGFYIGENKAISNAFYFYKKREPFIHHFTYNGKRKIETVFWHKNLKK